MRIVGHCDDMPAAYLLADVAILPTTVPETFGRTAVEPQAMGRPGDRLRTTAARRETVVDGRDRLAGPARRRPRPGPRPWRGPSTSAPAGAREMGQAGMNRARQLYPVDAMCEATLAAYERVLEAAPS